MSIDYKLVTAKGKERVMMAEACYAGVHCEVEEMVDDGLLKVRDDFEFWLIIGKTSSYWKRSTLEDRRLCDHIFDSLFGPWLGDWAEPVIYKRWHSHRQFIRFKADCPFWLICAAGSIYRMHQDMPMFLTFWRQTSHYSLPPILQYAIVVSLCSHGENAKNLDFDKKRVTLGSNTGHMPFDSHMLHVQGLKAMMNYEQSSFNDLDGMADQMWQSEFLTTMGRDERLCQHTPPVSHGNLIRQMCMTYDHEHLIKESTQPYSTSCTISLPLFIEEVFKPTFGV